jgi:hypothetical protein
MLQHHDARMPASGGPTKAVRTNNSRNTTNIVGASNSMNKSKNMDNRNIRANNGRNTCNSMDANNIMGANNSMDKGMSMDTSNSVYINNSRVAINSKDARLTNEYVEKIYLKS